MADSSDQLEKLKVLISSGSRADKCYAYSSLLHFQEQSSDSSASIQALAGIYRTLLSLIVADISDDDEEIAARALKCLGFMIYHPSLVAAVVVDDAILVIESLVKLIVTTKMKSVCNLGVWCISIQQFRAPFLHAHFDSLLQAVVHALNNPIGSLSTTFEAIQAVMKLATQLSDKMRDSSLIWAPPIYRRLLSFDKRERDMSERCLLKIKPIILPPPLVLSKALVKDIKQRLLTQMKELLKKGIKVQTIHAWGWFIRLLGSHAMKNRHLINEMLKIPEHTFSDLNPQVLIATQVAWEGLIDALIHPPIVAGDRNAAKEGNGVQQVLTSGEKIGEPLVNGFSKSIKLVMTPLLGIISGRCDISVHLSCLNTWCCLLHKLDTSVNDPSVIKLVLEPIFEAVFLIGPDNKSTRLWNLCLDLLDDFILAKCRGVEHDKSGLASQQSSTSTTIPGPSVPGKFLWKQYSVKWLPWHISQLDFHLKMILVLINQASIASFTHENRSLARDAALRLFVSVLKGVRLELKSQYSNYNNIMSCLGTVLGFIKHICEEVRSEGSDSNDFDYTSLLFIEAINQELEPTILGSPLYRVSLDLKHIDNLQSANVIRHANVLAICSFADMNMVTVLVYLVVLYFCKVFQLTTKASKTEFILEKMHKYFTLAFSSYDPLEILLATISLLYNYVGHNCLNIWIAIANGLKHYMDDVKELSFAESDSTGYLAVCYFLSYPFAICSSPQRNSVSLTSCSSEKSHVSPQEKRELEHVFDAWMALYGSLKTSLNQCSAMNSFLANLCSTLTVYLDEYASMQCINGVDSSHKDLFFYLLPLLGDAVICFLEDICASEEVSDESKYKNVGNHKISTGKSSSLRLAARYLSFLWTYTATDHPTNLVMTSRVSSVLAHFASFLSMKQDILLFIEIVSCPLLQWLSHTELRDKSIKNQLQLLWAKILNHLQSSQPPIVFNSAFLELQAPLLGKTLDHPNPTISEPTITFWNSTYGEQINLDYPQSLLHVLDKLSRNGRINLHKKILPALERCHSRLGVDTTPQRYRVTATHNKSSKRVGFVEDVVDQLQHEEKLYSKFKRNRLELTEHQKEVRRAQQGRERDCCGHGPGIRTYTSADFSQGNEDSQESQEFQNPESILEILQRVV